MPYPKSRTDLDSTFATDPWIKSPGMGFRKRSRHDPSESRAVANPVMKPLIVLLVAFGASWLLYRLFGFDDLLMRAGRTAMSAMLLFTALGHFLYPKGMALMLPAAIPARMGWVYFTGLLEIAAAVGLMIPAYQERTAMPLIAFFILVLPANIYAAVNHIDYQKGTRDGPGLRYLFFRIPLQILFIVWVYFFAY